ncbi:MULTISPECIES: hypothetical protein [Aeribacillus]
MGSTERTMSVFAKHLKMGGTGWIKVPVR